MVDALDGLAGRRVIAADKVAMQDLFGERPESRAWILREAFENGRVLLPPPVLTQLLSDVMLPAPKAARLRAIPLLEIHEGFWDRVGLLRALLKAGDDKAYLADCLTAQCCIDNDIPLLAYDPDFARFERAGLKLL